MKGVLFLLAIVCFVAAFVMNQQARTNPNLTELKDYWYIPIPLGILLGVLALRGGQKQA